jgi:LPS sulfotransferase NodH
MVRVDNDPTKTVAQPYLIVSGVRTGGTYLAHSLSNHPQVFCDRGESMHRLSIWRNKARQVDGHLLLHLLTHQEGYHASGFRMVYSQARPLIPYIIKERCKVIMLRRENVLRQSVSWLFHQMVRKAIVPYFPVHSFKEVKIPKQAEIRPEAILKWCRTFEQAHYDMVDALDALDLIEIEYSKMVGGEGETQPKMSRAISYKICGFLGVKKQILGCDLKRVHSHPLKAILKNWNDVEEAVKESPYARFLDDENKWTKKGTKWIKEA